MNYRPHGEHRLHCDDDIITAELLGTWNAEAAEHYGRDLRAHIRRLNGRPWARIIDLRSYELHTPEVIEMGKQFAAWAADNGCAFHCYIYSNALQRDTVKAMFEDISQARDEATTMKEAVEKCRRALARAAKASGDLQRR